VGGSKVMSWHPASKERMLASKGWMLGESFAFTPTNESLAYFGCGKQRTHAGIQGMDAWRKLRFRPYK